MFLESPWTRVDEFDNVDPHGKLPLTILVSPTCFDVVSTGQSKSPKLAEEVGDDDDEGALDRDLGGFELGQISAEIELAGTNSTHRIDLVHDSLESSQTGGKENATEGQGRITIITHRQEMCRSISTSPDDNIVAVGILLIDDLFRLLIDIGSLDDVCSRDHRVLVEGSIDGGEISGVDSGMRGNGSRDATHYARTLADDGIRKWCRHDVGRL